MKKLISYCIITGIFLGFGFINPNTNASQKVLDIFNHSFANVKDVKWFTANNEYTAVFEQNEIRTSISYDKDGHFLWSRRYYSEDHLPFNVLLKIKEKYEGKTIKTVTEVIQEDSIVYSVDLEDDKNYFVIESSGNTNIRLQSKFKKQRL